MTKLTTVEKYAQPEVVGFWKALSRNGLQQCEQVMVQRYLPPRGRLLDLGCGAGRAVLALSEAGFQVTGVDLSLAMLAAGRSLSAEAALNGADILHLPFCAGSFDGVFMFFGALQHIPGRANRRQVFTEMARVTQEGGRLVLGLDNVAPALVCYGYWLGQKLTTVSLKDKVTQSFTEVSPRVTGTSKTLSEDESRPSNTNGADSTLWSRETRQVHPLIWHLRGLARTLRWRTWPGLVDITRRVNPLVNGAELGDTRVAQFAVPVTPGTIYYHLYRAEELIEDAAQAGWYLLDYHSGSELNEGRVYPAAIRVRDKQLFFAFERG